MTVCRLAPAWGSKSCHLAGSFPRSTRTAVIGRALIDRSKKEGPASPQVPPGFAETVVMVGIRRGFGQTELDSLAQRLLAVGLVDDVSRRIVGGGTASVISSHRALSWSKSGSPPLGSLPWPGGYRCVWA